jgi:MFS family permease
MNPARDDRTRFLLKAQLVRASSSRLWLKLSVSVAVALAFADASIVVLALPQIVDRLHTSISHVTWVIIAYNLALIAGALAILANLRRLTSRRALIAGLCVFGLASLGSGTANALGILVALRCVQGAGGALLLCASLPQFAGATRSGESPLAGWAAAAAIGVAIGPAIGGLLTEAFDWRAIFFAQAPVAALAALAVAAAHPATQQESAEHRDRVAGVDRGACAERRRARLDPATANVALALISAGLIGALFLVTVLLINVWEVTPLGASAIVSAIPLATALTERTTRGRSPIALGAIGAVTLAAGLTALALVSHRQLSWVILALAACGTGLGMAFPALTEAALKSPGSRVARAARTVAARDAGLVLGLLILTPVFVDELNAARKRAIPPIAGAVLAAPVPTELKAQLAGGLLAADANAPQSRLPDIGPSFAQVAAQASAPTRAQLALLKARVQSLIQHAATRSFRRPLLYCALFALLVIPLLALRLLRSARKDLLTTETTPQRP